MIAAAVLALVLAADAAPVIVIPYPIPLVIPTSLPVVLGLDPDPATPDPLSRIPPWIPTDHPPAEFRGLLSGTHAVRATLPRIFSRPTDVMTQVLGMRAFLQEALVDPPPDRDVEAIKGEILQLENIYRRQIHSETTEVDWLALKAECAVRDQDLALFDWPTAMERGFAYYSPDESVLYLPELEFNDSGFIFREVAYHEFTHLLQFTTIPTGYAGTLEQFNGVDSAELGAFIVECDLMICDGLTAADWATNDHRLGLEDLMPELARRPGMTSRFHLAIAPRIAGGLAWREIVDHGPHLAGETAGDLKRIATWIVNFEKVPAFVEGPGWIEAYRAAIDRGETTHLAMCLQTWLAVNGELSWCPMTPMHTDDTCAPVITIKPGMVDVEPERAAAVKAFLERCGKADMLE